jgi:hypothetical protein
MCLAIGDQWKSAIIPCVDQTTTDHLFCMFLGVKCLNRSKSGVGYLTLHGRNQCLLAVLVGYIAGYFVKCNLQT